MARTTLSDKRNQLQNAALKVISRDGVSETSTRSIAVEAGQNLASISYAFHGKEALLISVQTMLQKDVMSVLEKAVAGCNDLPAALSSMADAYFKHTLDDPPKQRAHYDLTVYTMSKPEHRQLACEQYEAYIDALAQILNKFCRTDVDQDSLKVFASANLAAMDGVILQFLTTGQVERSQAALDLSVRVLIAEARNLFGGE